MISFMISVVPLRTFPTSDPYVRLVEFGEAALITHLISDAARLVIILDIPRAGGIRRGRLGQREQQQ
jgi:hypothetical protein